MLTKELKEEIKKRLTSKFDLEKIILFGSQARKDVRNKFIEAGLKLKNS